MKTLHLPRRISAVSPPPRQQLGMTLVELMVAMAISLVIALAAVAALTVARRGFTSVDTASQLRDNARFATDIMQRLGVQAGYQDVVWATTQRKRETGVSTNPTPAVFGINNASRASQSDLPEVGTSRTAGSAGYGSDILVLRYQASETFPGSGVADSTMINCGGTQSTGSSAVPTDRDDRMVSILYVAQSKGELSLMCSTSPNGLPPFSITQPLVQGVENFQVLYGFDGDTAGNPEPIRANQFRRADQLTVAGDDLQTNNNWRRVRSIRIGMVLRGAPGSTQDMNTQTFYPFGPGKASATGTVGSALSSASDPGTIFTPTPDGRLRQAFTFTIHLRNFQDQCAGTTCS